MKPRLAVVGTGIAGMATAYFLRESYDLTVLEKNDYVGGHTNTVRVHDGAEERPVDTGFMVFNESTYPNLLKLFAKLEVPYHDTDMSFTVADVNRNFEFNGCNLDGVFAQRRNALSPRFLRMLVDILRFGRGVQRYLADGAFESMTIGELIRAEGLGEGFTHDYLLPMTAAVWSTPHEVMLDYPAKPLVRFLFNHGLTGVNTQHQWKTVDGGSETYKQKLIASFRDRIRTKNRVVRAEKNATGKARLTYQDGSTADFDLVVFASHPDESLAALAAPTALQQKVLGAFRYQENQAWLHTDSTVMPRLRKNWSSWCQMKRDEERFTVYYMNRLQPVSQRRDFFININGTRFVDEAKVLRKITYHHPIFDLAAYRAQQHVPALNAEDSPFRFVGAWQRYGFHEDGLLSSVQLCERLLGRAVL